MKVLVAYATRHGSTHGIAERVARTLERNGLEVALERVTEDTPVMGYDAFVIGSAAYATHWLDEATRFVRRNAGLLATRPVWLFSSGPIGTDTLDKNGRDVIEASRPKEFTEFAGKLRPRDEHVFFGAYNPDAEPVGLADRFMQVFMRFMPSVRDSIPSGDFRDWPTIDAWAEGIAAELERSSAPVAIG